VEVLNWLYSGTAPQWGMFIVVVLAFAKLAIPWRGQNIASMERICQELKDQVATLTNRLDVCEETCRKRDDTILGMKKQAVAQQISFVRLLMKALGNNSDELQKMLQTLEQMEKSFEPAQLLEGDGK
jgi:hypothetical protein